MSCSNSARVKFTPDKHTCTSSCRCLKKKTVNLYRTPQNEITETLRIINETLFLLTGPTQVMWEDNNWGVNTQRCSIGGIFHAGGELDMRVSLTSNKSTIMELDLMFNGEYTGKTVSFTIPAGTSTNEISFGTVGVGPYSLRLRNAAFPVTDFSPFENTDNWGDYDTGVFVATSGGNFGYGTIVSVSNGVALTFTSFPGKIRNADEPLESYISYRHPGADGFGGTITIATTASFFPRISTLGTSLIPNSIAQATERGSPSATPWVRNGLSFWEGAPEIYFTSRQGQDLTGAIITITFQPINAPDVLLSNISAQTI